MKPTVIVFYDEGAQGTSQLGGGQLARLSLMEHLDRNVFTPILLTSKEGELAHEAAKRNIQVHISNISGDIPRFPRKLLFKKPGLLVKTVIQGLFAGYRLASTLKKLEADILHPNENLSRTISILSRIWLRIPLVTHIDGEWNKGITDIIMRRVFTVFYDKLIAVSDSVKNCFSNQEKIVVIHEGINPAKFDNPEVHYLRNTLQINSEEIVFCTVGKVVDFKGQNLVLSVLQGLNKLGINKYKYIIIGTGPDEDKLKKYVQENNLSENVIFTGFRNDVYKLIPGMDFLIHPSLTEAFPLVIIESGFAKLPVIASNVGGVAEIIENNISGLLIEPNNKEQILDALVKFLSLPKAELRQMGLALNKTVSLQYSLDICVKKTEQIYKELMI